MVFKRLGIYSSLHSLDFCMPFFPEILNRLFNFSESMLTSETSATDCILSPYLQGICCWYVTVSALKGDQIQI